MKYMHFAAAAPWTALANLLTLQGTQTEDYEVVLGARLHCMLDYQEKTGVYETGASLQGAKWYNLYLHAIGWTYMEFTYAREEALDYLWPLTMLKLRMHPSMPTDAVFLGGVDDVYTFMPSVYEQDGEARIEMSREELLVHLPEQVTLGSIRRVQAEHVDHHHMLEQSLKNWKRLRDEVRTFMHQEHNQAELRDGQNRLLSAPLHSGQTMMHLLGREDEAGRLMNLHHQTMRAVIQGTPLRLADVMSVEEVEAAISLFEEMILQELQGE